MKILCILAHPRKDSFCYAISEAARATLDRAGHTVIFHDLYAQAFDPVLKADEAYTVGEEVEDFLSRSVDPVIRAHRQDVNEAEGLVVVHPNWWGKPPAILSGWLDRVLVPGVAYRLRTAQGEPQGLLSMHRAVVFNTSDTPDDREQNVMGDPLNLIWKNCVLPFCGVDQVERRLYGPMAGSTRDDRESWLRDVESVVKTSLIE